MTRLLLWADWAGMAKRTPPRSYLDERAFPIRVLLRASETGADWIRWTDAEIWLREHVGPGEFAHHGNRNHTPYAVAFYFRAIAPAVRFLEAFPQFALADSTEAVAHLRSAREAAASGEKRSAGSDLFTTPADCRGKG